MRKIVLQMMTTLNGRLDDPMAWVRGVSDDQYREIEMHYAAFDTVLVGRNTYEEMAAYWPTALAEGVGTETNRRMARRMDELRKLVFSRSGREKPTEWNNTEQVVTATDDALATFLARLKAGPGGDIHLSGGAGLARSVAALGLVDEFRFFVYPVVSRGASWFAGLADKLELRLVDSGSYENGVVRLHYLPQEATAGVRPDRFADLLT